jgi:hypothetical protein
MLLFLLLLFAKTKQSHAKRDVLHVFCNATFGEKSKTIAEHRGPCATANADKHCLLLMKTFERAMTMIRGEFSARSHSQTSADLIGLLSVVFDQRCTLAEKLTHLARRVIGVPILGLQRERLEQIRTRLQNEAMNDARNNKIFKP